MKNIFRWISESDFKIIEKSINGSVFYEVIHNSEQKDKGVLVVPLSFELNAFNRIAAEGKRVSPKFIHDFSVSFLSQLSFLRYQGVNRKYYLRQ